MAKPTVKVETRITVNVTYKLGEQDPVAAQAAAEKEVGAACAYIDYRMDDARHITYEFRALKG